MFGAIAGGFSILSGIYSAYQQSEAQKRGEDFQSQQLATMRRQEQAAKQEQQRVAQMTSEQMNSANSQYMRYKEMYGGIEENLANYYNNLSPDVYSGQMKEAISRNYETAGRQLSENLAARGIQGSGVEAQGLMNLEESRANSMAQADIQAPQMVAEQQANFFNTTGFGQQQLANNNVQQAMTNQLSANATAYGNINSNFNNQANLIGNQAQNQFNLAGQYGNAAAQGVAGGFNALGKYADANSQKPTPSTYTENEFGISFNDGRQGLKYV